MTITRRLAPGVLVAGLAVATAACGSSHLPAAHAVMLNPAAVVDPLAGQTSVWVLQHATANTESAQAVHLTGAVMDSGHTLTFNLSIASSNGCAGTMSESGEGSFQMISDFATIWMKPDDQFWRVAAGVTDPATLSKLEGKYVSAAVSSSNLGAITSLCQLKTLLKSFASTSGGSQGEIKGPVTVMSGHRVLKVSDTADSAYVYVTDTAQPEMLQITDPGASDKVSFDYPRTPATIAPPPASEVVSQ